MIRLSTYLLLLIVIGPCRPPENSNEEVKRAVSPNSEAAEFNYSNFEIKKGQLGEIKIGMTISEAEQTFQGLRKEKGQATSFGFGGGSPAYLYYDKDDLVFALIPSLRTDSLLIVIALSPKLNTSNGLHPGSTVQDLSDRYPKVKVHQDLMNGGEFISDTSTNWSFVFRTDERTVGDYPEVEVPSDLKNFDLKVDWITIR